MKNMTSVVEFANIVTNLPCDKQDEFFNKIKDVLSEEDWKTTVTFISWIGIFKNQTKYKALRTALCEEMFGMEVPFAVKSMWQE